MSIDFEHCNICTARIHSSTTRSFGESFWCEHCYNKLVFPILGSVAKDLSNRLFLFVQGKRAEEEPIDSVFQFHFFRALMVSPFDLPPQGGNASSSR